MRHMRCEHEFGGVAIATAAVQNVVRHRSGNFTLTSFRAT
jgi:hypothetical protein